MCTTEVNILVRGLTSVVVRADRQPVAQLGGGGELEVDVADDVDQEAAGELSGMVGAVLLHYVDRALGPDGVLEVMGRLGAEHVVSLVENWENWVDFETVLSVAVCVAELCHEPDIGRRTGEELFRVLQERGLLVLGQHETLVDSIPSVVASFNTAMELRHAHVVSCDERVARIAVTSQEYGRSRFLCRLLVGLYAQIPSLRGAVGAAVEERCVNRGDDACEFVLRWREDDAPSSGVDPWTERVHRLQEWAVRVAHENTDHAPEAIEAVQLLEEIRRKALRDPLTGIANRSALELRAQEELDRRGSLDWLTLLFLDLDGFKPINDEWGHAAGDDLLRQLARRLEGAVRSTDLVARVGGDEFVVLFPEVPDDAMVEHLVRKVLSVFRDPYLLAGGHVHHLSGSAGISRSPDHGMTFEQLLDHADGAMYRVKKARRQHLGPA